MVINGFTVPALSPMFVNFCSGKMRSIFCGNFEYDARQSELERLFRRYGKVDRVDMKSGEFTLPIFILFCIF